MAIKRRGVLLGGTALMLGAPAILRAQSQQPSQKINVSHGFAMHGALKYAADAGPPDYLNPSAPKGGSVRLGARGTFDSLHPFIVKSQACRRHRRRSGTRCAGRRATRLRPNMA